MTQTRTRASPGWENFQRQLLEAEGVIFSAAGRIDLKRFGWEPDLRIRYQTGS